MHDPTTLYRLRLADERVGKLTWAHALHLRSEHGLSFREIHRRTGLNYRDVCDRLREVPRG